MLCHPTRHSGENLEKNLFQVSTRLISAAFLSVAIRCKEKGFECVKCEPLSFPKVSAPSIGMGLSRRGPCLRKTNLSLPVLHHV